MKVRITKASISSYWYSKQIENTFNVEKYDAENYILTGYNTLFISKSDCEIIEEEKVENKVENKICPECHGKGKIMGFPLDQPCPTCHKKEKPAKWCPLSKTADGSCVYYDKGTIVRPMCIINPIGYFPDSFEVCPFPSKQQPVKSEFDMRCERAWELIQEMRIPRIRYTGCNQRSRLQMTCPCCGKLQVELKGKLVCTNASCEAYLKPFDKDWKSK